jgi:hypothetical protein
MKITLPFDLLRVLDDTSIAQSYGLKNRSPENHTIIELSSRDVHDLLELLKALEEELHSRCMRFQKHSRSPIGGQRRQGIEERLRAIRRATELIGAKLVPLDT